MPTRDEDDTPVEPIIRRSSQGIRAPHLCPTCAGRDVPCGTCRGARATYDEATLHAWRAIACLLDSEPPSK